MNADFPDEVHNFGRLPPAPESTDDRSDGGFIELNPRVTKLNEATEKQFTERAA